MKRTTILRLAVATLAVALTVTPGPARAHATFESDTAPAGVDHLLALDVPEERGPDVHNRRVVVEVPGDFELLGCSTPQGWACEAEEAPGGGTLVSFTRGSAPAETRFDLAVHTPEEAGRYPFDVNQFYDDGSDARWDGPPDSDFPAPVLEVS